MSRAGVVVEKQRFERHISIFELFWQIQLSVLAFMKISSTLKLDGQPNVFRLISI